MMCRLYSKNIWVSIDEITNSERRYYVVNFRIGTLPVDDRGNIFLLTSEVLEKVKTKTSNVFNKTIFSL